MSDRVPHHYKPDSEIPTGYRAQNLPMYEVSERLKPLVDEFGLQQNLDDMRDQGWTVITGVPMDLTTRIREKIVELAADLPESDGENGFHKNIRWCLDSDPVFVEAATYPPLLVMAEYLVGARCVLSEAIATLKGPGGSSLGLHTDQPLIPSPYAEHMSFFTSCWALDEWDEAHGATQVVSGSNRLRRYPEPEEAKTAKTTSIVAPPGSIAIWGGFTWHDSGPRTAPGERVVLHLAYARQCFVPNNDFHRLGKSFIQAGPPALASLLGEGLPYGVYNDEPRMDGTKLGATVMDARS